MFKKIIHSLLLRRHYWRHANFDELQEIYISLLFRSFALGIIGIFIPVFLLQQGFGFHGVASFFVFFFGARVFADVASGFLVARFGPKHTILLSYASLIAASMLLAYNQSLGIPLAVPALLWGASSSLFFIAFHVDFSKIKHSNHGGKEIGYVNIMERIGGVIGPLIGGFVASAFGGRYIFVLAALFFIAGSWPLLLSKEPTRTHQKLDFKNFNVGAIKHQLMIHVFFAVEHSVNVALWPVYLTLFVFAGAAYAEIGALASLGFLMSVLVALTFGKFVDAKKGGLVLRISAACNAVINFVRPFVTSVPLAGVVTAAGESAGVGIRIPYSKGMYDAADSQEGHRIVYIVTMESFASAFKCLFWLELLILLAAFSVHTTLMIGFALAGFSSLMVMKQRFRALQ